MQQTDRLIDQREPNKKQQHPVKPQQQSSRSKQPKKSKESIRKTP